MQNNAEVSSSRTIAGFLREALFYSRQVIIYQDDIPVEAMISDIQESNARAQSETRHAFLKIIQQGINIHSLLGKKKIKCPFPQFTIELEVEIAIDNESCLTFRVPERATLKNERFNKRINPVGQNLIGDVLLQSNGLHAKAEFKLDNTSKFGIGGILSTSSGIPILSGTKIKGKIRSKTGIIDINGRIVNVQVQNQSKKNFGEAIYRVGIKRDENNQSQNKTLAEIKERRKTSRNKTDLTISIMSPLNPNHEVVLKLTDFSMTGFAATLVDTSDYQLMPAGISVLIKDSTILAEVVSFSDKLIHFQLVGGRTEDRLNWLKKVSTQGENSISARSANGLDLFNLFCESGALSAAYIKNQSKLAKEFTSSFSMDIDHPAWIHRWIERNEHGEVKGHVSAAKFGNSLWHIGNIAGSMDEDKKISKNFVPSFLNSFKEFCLSTEPCPHILIAWIEGHNYWKPFENFLATEGSEYVRGTIKTNYNRLNKFEWDGQSAYNMWTFKKVEAHEFEQIEKIQKSVSNKNCEHLLKALDFSPWTFGSPELQNIIQSSAGHFSREYYLLSSKKGSFLLILNQFPLGTSALRTEDVPWLFPIEATDLNKDDYSSLHAQIHHLAIEHGYDFPGIIEVVQDAKNGQEQKATKNLRWTLANPHALDFFREKYDSKK